MRKNEEGLRFPFFHPLKIYTPCQNHLHSSYADFLDFGGFLTCAVYIYTVMMTHQLYNNSNDMWLVLI